MIAVGGLYLLFEDSIIEQLPSTKRKEEKLHKPLISRAVVGIQVRISFILLDCSANFTQVGLVLLAMMVTRSSVSSIQARKGLPLGTQMVGWITMSMPVR
jgi:phosphatidylinositol glycan class N